MRTLLRRCVEVRRAIELSFGVVSGVGPGIHVLDGSPRASRGRGCSCPIPVIFDTNITEWMCRRNVV